MAIPAVNFAGLTGPWRASGGFAWSPTLWSSGTTVATGAHTVGTSLSRTALVQIRAIARRILRLRGHNVMLDEDLAALYAVETKALVRAMKRNRARFPPDFMFQLTRQEFGGLRSQSGTSRSWGGRRHRPYVFTEQGVAMLSSVLRSSRAVRVNIEIMRAFVRLRQMLESNVMLAKRLDDLERKYEAKFTVVFDAIRELMIVPAPPRKRIGFRA